MGKNSNKTIISTGWFCNKKCPHWTPLGFKEYCGIYKKHLEFNHQKDASKRCGPCLADFPTKAEPRQEDQRNV